MRTGIITLVLALSLVGLTTGSLSAQEVGKRLLFKEVTGYLEIVEFPDPQMPHSIVGIRTEEEELFFLIGHLAGRLRELIPEIDGLREKPTVIIGRPKGEIMYKGKLIPALSVEDYALPEVEGIDLGEEEIIKLKIKGEWPISEEKP